MTSAEALEWIRVYVYRLDCETLTEEITYYEITYECDVRGKVVEEYPEDDYHKPMSLRKVVELCATKVELLKRKAFGCGQAESGS